MADYGQLIEKVIAGDSAAFETLYRKTCKKVYFTCISFLKNEQDAADVSQEVYITVLKSLPNLADTSNFEAWIGRVTVNKCKDFLKKNRPVPMEDETLHALVDEGASEVLLPEECLANEAMRKIIMDILREELSDTLYQTVVLFYFHDMSATEIARQMNCPVGTVTSRLCIARAKIKKGVQNYEEKHSEKLYSSALVPILAAVLMAEANAMEPVDVWTEISSATSQMMNKTAVGSTSSSSGELAKPAVKTGGKAMFKSVKAKAAAAILAGVVVVGGVATVAVVTDDDKDNTKQEQTDNGKEPGPTIIVNEDGSYTIIVTPSGDKDNKPSGGNDKHVKEEDYYPMAEDLQDDIVNYFTALKQGDIPTLLASTDPGSELYAFLTEVQKYSWGEDLLRALYSNIEWSFADNYVEKMGFNLMMHLNKDETEKSADGCGLEGAFHVEVPRFIFMTEGYLYSYPKGTIRPEDLEFEGADEAVDFIKKTVDDNWDMLKTLSYGLAIDFREDGSCYFNIDTVYGLVDFKLDKLQREEDEYPQYYVKWDINHSLNYDVMVGDGGIEYDYQNDAIEEMLALLLAKDFIGLEKRLEAFTGEDYSEMWGDMDGKVAYSDLTAEEKAWFDDFLENYVEIALYEYCSVDEDGNPLGRYGTVRFSTTAITFFGDHMYDNDWILENRVMEHGVAYLGFLEDDDDIAKVFRPLLNRFYVIGNLARDAVEFEKEGK